MLFNVFYKHEWIIDGVVPICDGDMRDKMQCEDSKLYRCFNFSLQRNILMMSYIGVLSRVSTSTNRVDFLHCFC